MFFGKSKEAHKKRTLGAVIAESRRKAGLTQEAFAACLGITPQAVSKWETENGLPDVALLPEIAKTLSLTMDELFGASYSERESFPDKYEGLDFVFCSKSCACYSSKAVKNIDTAAGIAYFEDGSTANLNTRVAENRGEGEIRFYKPKASGHRFYGTKELKKQIDEMFDSLELKCQSRVNVKVESSSPGGFEAVGDGRIVDALTAELRDGTLFISCGADGANGSSDEPETRLTVKLPVETGNRLLLDQSGSGSVDVTLAFSQVKAVVSGSADVRFADCGALEANTTGSCDLYAKSASESADITVTGSSDVRIDSAANLGVRVAGSADVSVGSARNLSLSIAGSCGFEAENVTGDMTVKVSGSGDIKAAGEVDKLTLTVSGASDFAGGKLTADSADITAKGSAGITLGRIKTHSRESLGEHAKLKVLKRG